MEKHTPESRRALVQSLETPGGAGEALLETLEVCRENRMELAGPRLGLSGWQLPAPSFTQLLEGQGRKGTLLNRVGKSQGDEQLPVAC